MIDVRKRSDSAEGQIGSHLGHDEAVTVEVPWVFRAVLHGVEEKHRHDFCHAAA